MPKSKMTLFGFERIYYNIINKHTHSTTFIWRSVALVCTYAIHHVFSACIATVTMFNMATAIRWGFGTCGTGTQSTLVIVSALTSNIWEKWNTINPVLPLNLPELNYSNASFDLALMSTQYDHNTLHVWGEMCKKIKTQNGTKLYTKNIKKGYKIVETMLYKPSKVGVHTVSYSTFQSGVTFRLGHCKSTSQVKKVLAPLV